MHLTATTPGLEVHPHLRGFGRLAGHPWAFILPGNPKTGRSCCVRFCRRLRDGRNRACARCCKWKWRLNNPVSACFSQIRDRARRKRIPFDLTLVEFTAFAVRTGYADTRGQFTGMMHIDRIDALAGYHADNIQLLECSENSRKGATSDKAAHWLATRRGEPVYDPEMTPF